jgi:multiple sugar transport system substrate-binding protein
MQQHELSRRTMMKLMGAGVATAALAACAAPPAAAPAEGEEVAAPSGGEIPTLTLMTWGGVDQRQERTNKVLELMPEMADKYSVEVVSPGQHDAEVYQALRLALASGEELPTMIQMNYIGVPEFASAGVLMDMSEWIDPYRDDMLEGTKVMVDYEGKAVTVPRQAKTKIWYYRADMFDEAGIDAAAVQSYEDYMEAGRTLHEAFPESYIMNIGPQPIHYWYFMILTHWPSEEIRIANEDGSYNIVGNEHYETLLTWLNDWYTSGIAFNTDDWSADWQPAFNDGVIAGDLVSQWMDFFLPSFAPDQKGLWAKALWPEFNVSGSEAGGGVMVIPQGVDNAELGFDFLSKQYLDAEGAIALWEMESRAPMIASARDAVNDLIAEFERPEGMSDEDWAIHPINYFGPDVLKSHYEAMDVFKVFPYDPAASAELDILRKQTEAFLAGTKTLEEALQSAQSDMEAQIGNPYDV